LWTRAEDERKAALLLKRRGDERSIKRDSHGVERERSFGKGRSRMKHQLWARSGTITAHKKDNREKRCTN
jgi:hypothetical protein